MTNYLSKEYTDDNKLTHNKMKAFLFDKGFLVPSRVNFERVNEEKILTGDYLVVKDEVSKIIVYKNPLNLKLNSLLKELQTQANLEQTKKARRHNLNEQGYQDGINGVAKKEELEGKQYSLANPNRQKQFIHTKGYRRRHY